jgi:hypothetical protein
MTSADVLLKPEECVLLLVDFQAGLGFGVESMPRQTWSIMPSHWLARRLPSKFRLSPQHPPRGSTAVLCFRLCSKLFLP